MVSIKIGERVYPAYRSNRCQVCIHPGRSLIEERLLLNDTYPTIVEFTRDREAADIDGLMVPWPTLTVQQLTNHFNKGHCPIDTQVLHELSDQIMTEMGVDYTDVAPRIVSPIILSKLVMARGQERLMRGEIEPTMRETLAAAKLLHDIEVDTTGAERDRLQAYIDALEIYFNTVQRIVTPEQWSQIGSSLAADPVLREIENRLSVEDADIIEEGA